MTWTRVSRYDERANELADRHYSRRKPGSKQIGPPGRKLVFITDDGLALWLSHWPYGHVAWDRLDAFRCSIFRNEGAGLSSELIRAAMDATEAVWGTPPADGWVTWVDTRFVRSSNPGYCFKRAGWTLDREYDGRPRRPYLVRLRA